MTAKEIREAAENLKNWTLPHGHPERGFCEWRLFDNDIAYGHRDKAILDVAYYILANVPEDGEIPVDEAWLREEWGWTDRDGAYCYGRFKMRSSANGNGKWMLMWDNGATWPRVISTRSQFRSLMKGLGIEPKKYLKKI